MSAASTRHCPSWASSVCNITRFSPPRASRPPDRSQRAKPPLTRRAQRAAPLRGPTGALSRGVLDARDRAHEYHESRPYAYRAFPSCCLVHGYFVLLDAFSLALPRPPTTGPPRQRQFIQGNFIGPSWHGAPAPCWTLARVGLSRLLPYQGEHINELWHRRSNLLGRASSLEPARFFRKIDGRPGFVNI